MSFIDVYKRLEKLCGEIYGDKQGVSLYIDDMKNHYMGTYYVSGWDNDLSKLKHYRWVRNQIVHEPGCTEENMCEAGDVQWLEDFYDRIMSGNDPLALYRKARTPEPKPKPKPIPQSTPTEEPTPAYSFEPSGDDTYPQESETPTQTGGCATWLLLLVVIAVIFIILRM